MCLKSAKTKIKDEASNFYGGNLHPPFKNRKIPATASSFADFIHLFQVQALSDCHWPIPRRKHVTPKIAVAPSKLHLHIDSSDDGIEMRSSDEQNIKAPSRMDES
jgi:hypothetical protein